MLSSDSNVCIPCTYTSSHSGTQAKTLGSLDLLLPYEKQLNVPVKNYSSVLSSETEGDEISEVEDGEKGKRHQFPVLSSIFF